jgi:hypothetical protein
VGRREDLDCLEMRKSSCLYRKSKKKIAGSLTLRRTRCSFSALRENNCSPFLILRRTLPDLPRVKAGGHVLALTDVL